MESAHPVEFRKRVAGICLIAAPIFLGAGETLHLSTGNDAAELEIAGLTKERAGVWFAVGLLEILSVILSFPAIAALSHLFGQRAIALGHLAVGLLVTAFVTQAGYAALLSAANWTAADLTQSGDAQAVDIGVTLAYANTLEIPLSLLGLVALITLVSGLLALASGIWSSRLVPRWIALVIAAAGVLSLFEWEKLLADVVPYVLLCVGLGGIGGKVLGMSTAEWERIRGTAPLAAQERP